MRVSVKNGNCRENGKSRIVELTMKVVFKYTRTEYERENHWKLLTIIFLRLNIFNYVRIIPEAVTGIIFVRSGYRTDIIFPIFCF